MNYKLNMVYGGIHMSHSEKWQGTYEYKGFVIYNTDVKEWIVEPLDWSDNASQKFKYSLPLLETIAKAKKWIRENGANLKESDYL
jgi:hypothetical protein